MSKIDEHKLEQYIRFPYELSSEEKKEIRLQIETSDEVQAMYLFLKEFYEEYDRTSRSSKSTIPLTLLPKEIYPGPVVLAAMSGKDSAPGLATKATLVSEEHNTLVRVLENEKDHTLQFHVIGKQKHHHDHVILSLLNPQIDLVTNEQGKLKGVRELSDVNWASVSTLLRIPVFKRTVQPGKSDTSFHIDPNLNTEIRIQKYDQHVLIKMEGTNPGLSRVLLAEGKSSELKSVTGESISFELTDPQSQAVLYFYE